MKRPNPARPLRLPDATCGSRVPGNRRGGDRNAHAHTGLDWKRAVVNHHREVPYRLVHCDGDLSTGDPGAGNLLVQGGSRRSANGRQHCNSRRSAGSGR